MKSSSTVGKWKRAWAPVLAIMALGLGACSTTEGEDPGADVGEAAPAEQATNPGNASALPQNVPPANGAVAPGTSPTGSELNQLVTDGSKPANNPLGETPPPPADGSGLPPPVNATGGATLGSSNAMPPPPAPVDPLAAPSAPNAAPLATQTPPTDPFAPSAAPAVANTPAAPDMGGMGGGMSGGAASAPQTAAAPAPVETAPKASSGNAMSSLPSSPGVLPPNGVKLPYFIQKGDTLASIAKKIYGNMKKWRELAKSGGLVNPNKIYRGDVLLYMLDDASRPFAERYETAARKSVVVKKGDTLASISKAVYGSPTGWRTLWKENPQIKNPDVLKVGMTLSFRNLAEIAKIDMSKEAVAHAVPYIPGGK